MTSKIKGYPFDVSLPAGLLVGDAVLADQIKGLDWKARQVEFAAKSFAAVVEDVLALVLPLIGEED